MYQLIERIINDSKLSTAASKTEDSFSKLFEKHRIEQNINLVMNKLDTAQISEQFIESLVHSSINLSETPNFYQKIIKRAITQGVSPTKKSQEVEGETATPPVEEAKEENIISPSQYLTALGAHKTFLGNLTVAQQQRAVQYLKNPYFSVKRIEKELNVGGEKSSGPRDHSDFDSMLVRGFRVAQRIQ